MLIAGSFLKIQDSKEKIDKLNDVVDQIHYDIMDGKFTEKPTLNLNILKENTKDITKPIDIHLMVNNIKWYIDNVLSINPEYITFHIEATSSPMTYIKYIKGKNIKVGLAVNPETDFDEIYEYLDDIDLVLIMSVPPGDGGRPFIDVSDKIEKLIDFRERNDLSYIIEVDGGINDKTIKLIKKADISVVGSFITNSDDYKSKVDILRRSLHE